MNFIVVLLAQYGALTLITAPYQDNVVLQVRHGVFPKPNVSMLDNAVNMTPLFIMYGVLSKMHALTSVPAAVLDNQHANVQVEPLILIKLAMIQPHSHAAQQYGVDLMVVLQINRHVVQALPHKFIWELQVVLIMLCIVVLQDQIHMLMPL